MMPAVRWVPPLDARDRTLGGCIAADSETAAKWRKRYYRGLGSTGEPVTLQRDGRNQSQLRFAVSASYAQPCRYIPRGMRGLDKTDAALPLELTEEQVSNRRDRMRKHAALVFANAATVRRSIHKARQEHALHLAATVEGF